MATEHTGTLAVETAAGLCAARRSVSGAAAEVLGGGRAADVELCVSELLTNALEHGTSGADLRSETFGDSFVVTVTNRSDHLPRPAVGPVPHDHLTGRGLQIVQRVADGLAIHSEHGGVVVICRFDS